MIRAVVVVLALALAVAPRAEAAIAIVQTVSCVASAATTCTTPAGVTTTAGSLLIASAGFCCAGFTSITDNKGNTYAVAIPQVAVIAADGLQRYVASNAGGSSHTVTLTGASGAFYGTLSVSEVSGATASPLDQQVGSNDAGSTTSHASPSTGTTTQANELLIGFGTSV